MMMTQEPDLVTYAEMTFADTVWHEFRASDLVAGGLAGLVTAGGAISPLQPLGDSYQLKELNIESVATAAISVRLRASTGDTDTEFDGRIWVAPVTGQVVRDLHGKSITIGNLTVDFVRNEGGSTGTTIDVAGKTRAQIISELHALVTVAATGIADFERAISSQPGTLAMHSSAASAITTSGIPDDVALAVGMHPATALPVAISGTRQIIVPDPVDTRIFAIRAAGNAVVKLTATWVRRAT